MCRNGIVFEMQNSLHLSKDGEVFQVEARAWLGNRRCFVEPKIFGIPINRKSLKVYKNTLSTLPNHSFFTSLDNCTIMSLMFSK